VTDLIALGDKAPLVISVSYGWGESAECSSVVNDKPLCRENGWDSQEYVNATNILFMKFGVTGHTMVVCTQDEGAPGEQNDDCSKDDKQALYPEYPASSPYVFAVGSTAIQGSGNGIQFSQAHQFPQATLRPICQHYNCNRAELNEVVADLPSSIFTSGGGFSRLASQPSYQQAAVAAYLQSNLTLPPPSKFNQTNRAYPDVSSIGQNVPIVFSGSYLTTGGTSASTPIWAGIITLLNDFLISHNESTLGFPNQLFYQMAAKQPNTFHKVLSGNNSCTEELCCEYGFLVNPNGGWNPATGLGTPNYLNIISYLANSILKK
jgi:tripeptidyl-peptidase-1